MKARLYILTTLLAAPLCVQAQSDIPTTDPVQAVGATSLTKDCDSSSRGPLRDANLLLSRNEVARGFGRTWEPAMEELRDGAIDAARAVCRDGHDGVQFSFLAGNGSQDLAIAATAGAVDAVR